ncbi:sensor histidine kinase [Novosphingobium mangrovi (ex Huang et al. 2023)]|uniref:histidine kinase n=1 Tax=Novosphingobium mangrovi (ex Huang et al. 2023) TaxID=2976432 RepID=A0ABT2I4U7_9SPHN|nr:PAS domain-containing sensor histidine kinase [Novosphingobium mangrovi (ex Huang et al. 2023)]MCT2399830.1 PAS domain-containing sensor histidine kinase [Novosphingobium mangrovi (ex Huang et al. 2023)]
MTLASPPPSEIHAALEHAPVGALIVDATGTVSWANAAAARIFGESDPAALRHTPLHGRLDEHGAETLHALIDLHFATPAQARTCWTRQLALADGSGPVEVTIAAIPDTFEHRAILYVRSLAHQVAAERRFEQIFEHLPLGLVVVDARQRIVQANASLAAVFGYAGEALVGQPLEMLLPERYRKAHGSHFEAYCDMPRSRMMGSGRDLTGLHRSGQEIPVEIALTRLENAGQPLYLAIVTDISGRKRSESALQQTNAQLEEFTYVASHDLRSPLRGIADLATWIREDLGEDGLTEDIRHNFDRIALRIRRCEQMIDDLLDYARAGVRDQRMESIDPRALIDEAMAMAAIPENFTVEIDVTGTSLTAPRAPLFTSLRNLLANAAKHHGGDAGHIRVVLREEGRFSIFTVEDDGKGITPGNEERIFKLFHRASPGTEGDGVGLAFTRRMINAHGGMVTVQGQGPLGGASFAIHWPRILLREFDDE